MITTAFVFDAVQGMFIAIPLAGWLLGTAISIFSFLTYFLWFKFHDIELGDGLKKFLNFFGIRLIDAIPVIGQILPGIVLSTVLTIVMVKADDVLYNHNIDLELTTSKKLQRQDETDGHHKVPQFIRTFASPANDTIEDEKIAQESFRGTGRQNPPLANQNYRGIASNNNNDYFKKAA